MTDPTYNTFTLPEYMDKIKDGSLLERQRSSSWNIDLIIPEGLSDEVIGKWFRAEERMDPVASLDEVNISAFAELAESCSTKFVLYDIGKIVGDEMEKSRVELSHCNVGYIGGQAKVHETMYSTLTHISDNATMGAVWFSDIVNIDGHVRVGGRYSGIRKCNVNAITGDAVISQLEGGLTHLIDGNATIVNLINPSMEDIERAKRRLEDIEQYRGDATFDKWIADYESVIAQGIKPMTVKRIAGNAQVYFRSEHVTVDELGPNVTMHGLSHWEGYQKARSMGFKD